MAMKVAVAASGDNLDAAVDPRFGRCPMFLIVDTDTMQFQALPNPGAQAGQGAGIQAAQLVANAGVQAVIAGNYGPNAHQALSAGGIEALTGAAGTVRQAVEAFKAGQLTAVEGATVPSHFGLGATGAAAPPTALGPGAGAGRGRGMGGGGRGMGGGGGRGRGMGGGGWRGRGGR
jgi:predicted Fe-Mo cluster-binding NifX family protein